MFVSQHFLNTILGKGIYISFYWDIIIHFYQHFDIIGFYNLDVKTVVYLVR